MEFIVVVILLVILIILVTISLFKNINESNITERLSKLEISTIKELSDFKSDLNKDFNNLNEKLEKRLLLITLPFTPSCFINILGGLARVPKRKFVVAIFTGKIFTVIFWGFIGKTFIESIYNIKIIIFIVITLLIAYIVSKIVSKKMNIE